jgi:hypothetical protein
MKRVIYYRFIILWQLIKVHDRNEDPPHLTPLGVFTSFLWIHWDIADRVKSFRLSSLHGYGGTNHSHEGPKNSSFRHCWGRTDAPWKIWFSKCLAVISICQIHVMFILDFHVFWYFSVSKFRKNEQIKLWWDGAPTTVPLNGYDYCYVCCNYAVAIE